jgi:aerobic carbon-monoxide dehydrogenase large subunit
MSDTGSKESNPKKFGIGQSVPRFEDPRLLRGKGCFVDDINLVGQAYAYILRSPHAHAVIKSIDSSAARAAPGVLAVYTGDDVAKDGLGTMKIRIPRKRPDGSPMFARSHTGLTQGRVRFVGDPVAMIVAESVMQARDASELINIDYEPLPSVTDTASTVAPDAPKVWDECPDNISNVHQSGKADAVTVAFASAAHVVKRRYVISRVFAHYLQPRGVLASYDEGDERYTIWADVQYPHRVRNALAENIFKIPEHRIRVIANDVGGGFGTKGWQYPEHRLMPWAARKLGRPVKWLCDRSEAILADEHARDNVSDAELALDKDGRFLGLRVRTLANVGAYVSSDRNLLSTFANVHTLSGVYDIPAAHVTINCVMSNTNATAPYRGAGRPESIYIMERLIDDTARELGMDRIALRRKNIIASTSMPYRNPFGSTYDCGEFARGMDMALQAINYDGFEARRAESAARGMLRGIGVVNAIESAASPMQQEFAEIRFNPSGSAIVMIGTKHQGQGHETLFKQIVHERLGLDPSEVQFIDGDTDRVSFGMGTNGSRSTVVGGTALWRAADKIIAKGKKIAAHLLEASSDDIEFADGVFNVAGADMKVSLADVAKAAFLVPRLPAGFEGGFYETATFAPSSDTYPNGTHVCEVEVDPLTGSVAVLDYVVADDVGTMINPAGVKGQIHGGVAQGLGQALMEQVVYDRETGQLLSGSFMDYAMPRASDMPMVRVKSNAVPTALNPLGAKGAGEAGTVGAIPSVINAIIDALSPLGVTTIEMPATSGKIWAAIRAARATNASEGVRP